MRPRAKVVAATAAAASLLLVGACRKSPKPVASGPATASAPGPAPLVRGDQASLRRYLETVDTVEGATLKVTWSPRTVRLTRDETLRSLRRVSRDGARFTFAANEPRIRDLQPGAILLVWGIALRKVTAVEPHFNFDIPLIIGGLPFMVELGTDLLVAPALTSHHALATATYNFTYGGDAGLTVTSGGMSTDGEFSGDATTASRQITSLGVSAVLVAVQAPRIGFGLGLFNTSTVAYVDHVMAASITSAGGLSLIPCRRYELNRVFHAGVETKLLGLTIPQLGTKKELGTPWRLVETEPKGLNCGS